MSSRNCLCIRFNTYHGTIWRNGYSTFMAAFIFSSFGAQPLSCYRFVDVCPLSLPFCPHSRSRCRQRIYPSPLSTVLTLVSWLLATFSSSLVHGRVLLAANYSSSWFSSISSFCNDHWRLQSTVSWRSFCPFNFVSVPSLLFIGWLSITADALIVESSP